MKITIDSDDLRPVIEAAVVETIRQIEADKAQLGEELALPEPQAAARLGVARHILRDARLRGEIVGCRIGKRICYERSELLKFLRRCRTKSGQHTPGEGK